MKTTKPSNYLTHSNHEFTDYHLETVDKIHRLIEVKNFEELGRLRRSIPEDEATYVHYAFLDKYEYSWVSRVHKIQKEHEELVKYRFI